jgi:ubiquinone/menaquinone biosynthesis C-methylase UbiE
MDDRRFPASQAQRLDDPERLLWLPPAEVIGALSVRSGDTIADVGAGTGYFSFPMSHAVGAAGKIYAVDGQGEMLAWLKLKLDKTALTNIELIRAEAGQTGLPASSCDLFFLANLWHEIEDRVAVLFEARRVLKNGGRIAILDWRTDVEPVGGPPLAHRIAPSDALGELRLAGFEQLASANAGRYSWLVHGEKAQ